MHILYLCMIREYALIVSKMYMDTDLFSWLDIVPLQNKLSNYSF